MMVYKFTESGADLELVHKVYKSRHSLAIEKALRIYDSKKKNKV